MATTVVSDPSGKEYEVNHPDGASDDEIIAYAKNYFGKVAAPVSTGGGIPPASPSPKSPYPTPPMAEMLKYTSNLNPSLPTARQVLGQAAILGGGLATGGMGALATKLPYLSRLPFLSRMAGEALGSGGVQVAENVLSGEAPTEHLGRAAAMPVAFRAGMGAIGGAGRVLGKLWPGSAHAQQELAAGKMRGLAQGINAPAPSAVGQQIESFLQRIKGNPEFINAPSTRAELQKLREELQPLIYGLKSTGDEGMVRALESLASGGGLPLHTMQSVLHRTGQLAASRDTSLGSMWKLRQSLKADLGRASGPQAAELTELRSAYRRAKTKEEITNLGRGKGFSAPTTDSRIVETHPGAIKNTLLYGQGAKGEELHRRFLKDLTQQEREEIIRTLNEISTVPRAGTGFARYAGHPYAWALGLGTLGAFGGYQQGGVLGAGTGALLAGAAGASGMRKLGELSKKPKMQAALNALIANQVGQGEALGGIGAGFGRILTKED